MTGSVAPIIISVSIKFLIIILGITVELSSSNEPAQK
jgi:hypothetical protein